MWVELLLAFIGLFLSFYLYMTRKFSFFKGKGIPYMEPTFPFGSSNMFKTFTGQSSFVDMGTLIYQKYPGSKLVGQFQFSEPQVMINDLELAKNIMIKDFDYFMDRRPFSAPGKNKLTKVMSRMLTSLKGEQWKTMRSIVSPVFTSGKLKSMTVLINKVGDDFVDHMAKYCESGEPFDAKKTFTNFTLDTIANCGFGFEARTLKNPDNQFRAMITKLTGGNQVLQLAKFVIITMCPWIMKIKELSFFDEEAGNFILDIFSQSMEERKKSKVKRNDLLDLLMDALEADREGIKQELENDQFDQDAQVQVSKKSVIPDDEIDIFLLSNAFILFFAGFDTSSTIMSITSFSWPLMRMSKTKFMKRSLKPLLQNNGSDNLDYNTIQGMSYLDKVVHETLRLYPLTMIERMCVKDYKVPGTDFVIPKGMLVQIPSTDIMRDPQYYDNPNEFNPENFSPEAKAKRSPYSFLAFGQGPRNCVGMRFALLQVKISVIRLVAHYRLEKCAKTVSQLIPDPRSQSLQPKGGIWLSISPRNAS
uniref:Cytochrome P450 CYP3025A1 n=1 Tax=Tigriopus japonicus TaxID=158387 RepID=A0A088DHX6_TIGJA|nr:cytochrome P450 CYP3025A1 [Tigriopus japonicus]